MSSEAGTDRDAGRELVEVERKFDVDDADVLPSFRHLAGVAEVREPVEYRLDAVYFDTPELVLAARGITLRRRRGGADAGWHLKTAAAETDQHDNDARREFHEPLGTDAERVPERLLDLIRVHVRDRPLVPVVRLQTQRLVSRLQDRGGEVLAEVSDDRVEAARLVEPPMRSSWREWEVELVTGGRPMLDAAESLLNAQGVRRSGSSSKLARALGDRRPALSSPERIDADSAGALVLRYLDAQVRQLWHQDPLVRQDEPDALHQMRVASRRLRSVLRSYRRLLDASAADELRSELGWLAGILGAARDAQVLRQRLADRAATIHADGAFSAELDHRLGGGDAATRGVVLDTLNGIRYFRLLDALDGLLAKPPLTDAGLQPAVEMVPELLDRECARLRSAVKAAHRARQGRPRDLLLHEARKAAKRVRYAAEALAGAAAGTAAARDHEPAERIAAAAEELQTILGEHQDGVVARRVLRAMRKEATSSGHAHEGYRALRSSERAAAVESEAEFFEAWKGFPGSVGELRA